MAERRVSSRLMRPKTPRFWPEMKTRRGFGGIVAAVSLVDIGTLDLAAGEPLSGFDDGAQRVAVIRIAGQRPGVQNKLATRCPGIGGDDGSFHTEFVRRAGLALADALHLRSVEGIRLPAALALLLRARRGSPISGSLSGGTQPEATLGIPGSDRNDPERSVG